MAEAQPCEYQPPVQQNRRHFLAGSPHRKAVGNHAQPLYPCIAYTNLGRAEKSEDAPATMESPPSLAKQEQVRTGEEIGEIIVLNRPFPGQSHA